MSLSQRCSNVFIILCSVTTVVIWEYVYIQMSTEAKKLRPTAVFICWHKYSFLPCARQGKVKSTSVQSESIEQGECLHIDMHILWAQ